MSTVELKVRRRIEAIFKSENLTTIDKAKASLLTVLPLDKETRRYGSLDGVSQ